MNELVPIGRFSTMTRLSIKALRHYDDIGLLEPAEVDRQTGYRFYRMAQANRAEAIRILRSVDMPLDEITQVLADDDADVVRKHLVAHRERLEARLADQRRMLDYLHRIIDNEETLMPYHITVKDVAAATVASHRVRTSLATIGDDLAAGFRQVAGALTGPPSGAPFVIYHDVIDTETDGEIEICIPVDSAVRPGTGVAERTIEAATVVSTVHRGPYDEIAPAYHTLTGWAGENKRTLSGPAREIYLNDPTEVAPDELRTEVQWPMV